MEKFAAKILIQSQAKRGKGLFLRKSCLVFYRDEQQAHFINQILTACNGRNISAFSVT